MDWLADFLEYIAADKGCSPLTVQSYGVALRQFREFFTGLDATWTWTDVDADVVRRWVAARRAEGIHPHSLQRSLSALRTFYRYLIRTDRAVRNPAYGVRNPKAGKSLPAFVRPKEMDRLLDHTTFPDDFFGRRDHLILLLLYSTGVRRAELVGLNVGDVDLASSELKVTGKRNKQRIIPFGTELCEALRSYISELSERPCSDSSLTSSSARPLFPSKRGSRISPDSVGKVVHDYLSLVTSQRRRTPHVLRHSFATAMLNGGADLEAVRALLGHESLRTTEIYTHASFAELRREYAKAHPRNHSTDEEPQPPKP